MGYGAAILAFLKALPKLVELGERLYAQGEKFIEVEQRKAKALEMRNAIEVAKISKDTSKIEDLFNGKR